MHRGILNDPGAARHLLTSGLKLRLDQRHDPPAIPQQPHRWRQDQSQRNERAINHRQIEWLRRGTQLAQLRQGQVTRVHLFERFDARILPDLPGQLPVPNIDCHNTRRPMLKQTIGKSTRTRAEINGPQPGGIHREVFKGMLELVTAATDVTVGVQPLNRIAVANGIACLACRMAVDAHLPRHHRPRGLGPRLAESAVHQGLIDAYLHRTEAGLADAGGGVESLKLKVESRCPVPIRAIRAIRVDFRFSPHSKFFIPHFSFLILPMPPDEPLDTLRNRLITEIEACGGVISFARFMERALYEPKLGYYESDRCRVGRRGDFYTSVSTGPLFGELLAQQFLEWIATRPDANHRPWTWLECGAHDARLAKDFLSALDAHPNRSLAARVRYAILESSPERRAWQQSTLARWQNRVEWLDAWPQEGVQGVILSNELLDAFPVHRIGWNAAAQDWFEWGVRQQDNGFSWAVISREQSGIATSEWLDVPPELAAVLPDGFTTEIHPAATAWWAGAARSLREGWLMTSDYGLDRLDFFQPQRAAGTLRAYRDHRVSDQLLADPGNQDLTAQVDFSAAQAAGEAEGLITVERTSQRRWLTGIVERRVSLPDGAAWLTPDRVRQFQTLTHPDHLGRGFSVLVQRTPDLTP